jgi:hypothetical protein
VRRRRCSGAHDGASRNWGGRRIIGERLTRDLIGIPDTIQDRQNRRIGVIGLRLKALLHMCAQILNDLRPALGRYFAECLLKPSEVLIQNRVRDRIFHLRSPRPKLHQSHP